MKIEWKSLAIIIGLSIAIGFLVGWLAHNPQITPVEITVPDEPIKRVDTLKTTDTLWRDGKIVYIVDTMRVKDLPWTPHDSNDSIVLKSGNNRYLFGFQLRRWVKGLNGGYEIFPTARTFTIDVPVKRQFPLHFGLTASISVNHQKQLFPESEVFCRWRWLQLGVGLATDRGTYGKITITTAR